MSTHGEVAAHRAALNADIRERGALALLLEHAEEEGRRDAPDLLRVGRMARVEIEGLRDNLSDAEDEGRSLRHILKSVVVRLPGCGGGEITTCGGCEWRWVCYDEHMPCDGPPNP